MVGPREKRPVAQYEAQSRRSSEGGLTGPAHPSAPLQRRGVLTWPPSNLIRLNTRRGTGQQRELNYAVVVDGNESFRTDQHVYEVG